MRVVGSFAQAAESAIRDEEKMSDVVSSVQMLVSTVEGRQAEREKYYSVYTIEQEELEELLPEDIGEQIEHWLQNIHSTNQKKKGSGSEFPECVVGYGSFFRGIVDKVVSSELTAPYHRSYRPDSDLDFVVPCWVTGQTVDIGRVAVSKLGGVIDHLKPYTFNNIIPNRELDLSIKRWAHRDIKSREELIAAMFLESPSKPFIIFRLGESSETTNARLEDDPDNEEERSYRLVADIITPAVDPLEIGFQEPFNLEVNGLRALMLTADRVARKVADGDEIPELLIELAKRSNYPGYLSELISDIPENFRTRNLRPAEEGRINRAKLYSVKVTELMGAKLESFIGKELEGFKALLSTGLLQTTLQSARVDILTTRPLEVFGKYMDFCIEALAAGVQQEDESILSLIGSIRTPLLEFLDAVGEESLYTQTLPDIREEKFPYLEHYLTLAEVFENIHPDALDVLKKNKNRILAVPKYPLDSLLSQGIKPYSKICTFSTNDPFETSKSQSRRILREYLEHSESPKQIETP